MGGIFVSVTDLVGREQRQRGYICKLQQLPK